jgi:hypothetical protein
MEKYHTQWAAQFYAAAELSRRGYTVSFTLGNAKGTDLYVESPNRKCFSVEVKGAKTKSGWYVKESQSPGADFFILVYVPVGDESPPPQFFVLTRRETENLVKQDVPKYMEKHDGVSREEAKKKVQTGVSWKDATAPNAHKDRWNKLPP